MVNIYVKKMINDHYGTNLFSFLQWVYGKIDVQVKLKLLCNDVV